MRWGDGAALAAAVCGPLLLYWLTLPRTVVLEDDGLFLMATTTLGVAHPPGYPLYTLIGYLFAQLPFGSPAVLGHLSSAFLGALASAAVYVCARLLGASAIAALAGAWLFAASEHVWSQAIIAEVYTLNALLFFACLALVLRGVAQPERRGWWLGAAAVYGLSLANHWPLMVLATPGLLVVALPAAKTLRSRPHLLLAMSAVALATAALPYLGMVFRSWQAPPISFYGAIEDWAAFLHYFSRAGYADANPIAGWGDRLAYLLWFGDQLLWQLTLPGFALAVLGAVVLVRSGRSAAVVGCLMALLGNSATLLALLEFEFDFKQVAIFRPYSLVCYGVAAIFLAIGLQFAAAQLASRLPAKPLEMRKLAQPALAALAGLAMCAASVAASWSVNNRADTDFARAYADVMFALLPQDVVMLVQGDLETAVLGYYRHVEQRRPDVELVSTQGLVYANRLFHPGPEESAKNEAIARFLAETDRPIFYSTYSTGGDFIHGYGFKHHGFLQEVVKDGPSNAITLEFSETAAGYFRSMLAQRPRDGWEQSTRLVHLHHFGQYLAYALLLDDATLANDTRELRRLAESHLASLMGLIQVVLKYGNASHHTQVEAWVAEAERLQDSALDDADATMLSRWRRAELLYLSGVLRGRQGSDRAATDAFLASWRLHPAADNPARDALAVHGIEVSPER